MRTSRPSVVAGVSGSPSSQRAVEAAAREAARHGCPLHLVHAFNWLPTLTALASVNPGPAGQKLVRAAAAAAARVAPDLSVTTQLVEGSAVTGLLRKSHAAAMTVIGDGDLNSRICLPRDAVATQIVARAPCSVMVTRAAPLSDGPVLVGVNGSAASELALDFAFDAAAQRTTNLIIVHVWDSATCTEQDHALRVSALARLVAAREDRYPLAADVRVLEGEPATVLRYVAQDAGLVVVGARGRQAYGGLLGSVAQTLLHHSPAPVVIVRGLMPTMAPRPKSRPAAVVVALTS
ncbi:nucleotide-binding universal stress UspA family protein [Krasilnikovia cinnamomea]|uniref:Nucleotide-binding universal stress UspA family protein n=1 Tax=Krasilnikovia cinnamomea TaxID=349313 RepID=A0A4Q7ZQ50_9ACTN|nr:universal stress protein [Krasilnikovia cinnamomea]RZU53220.1 nucleotide-binding universal stress UspA family protein [Krasilnikovia cinnamomea]